MRSIQSERLGRLRAFDGACVFALNRSLAYRPCLWLARAVSRMGDGGLWGMLILGLLLSPLPGATRCALHMMGVGLVGVGLYLLVKRRAGRPRPCVRLTGLTVCARPLDEFSFPSGHTLHAASFSLILAHHFPPLAPAVFGFALLVAASRPVLGLHYPSDVLAGAAIGACLAGLTFFLF